MEKLMVENREIDIEEQLSEYRELARQRNLLDERIRRTDAEKVPSNRTFTNGCKKNIAMRSPT